MTLRPTNFKICTALKSAAIYDGCISTGRVCACVCACVHTYVHVRACVCVSVHMCVCVCQR